MGSQYDAIGARYGLFKTLPLAATERENFKAALVPYLARTDRPRVLDLACGTGYYSHKLLEWGAGSVLGLDLSSGMIEAADATLSEEDRAAGRLRFAVGDALRLESSAAAGAAPFDIVTGSWLLNYAGSLDEMSQMFRGIAARLAGGGAFVGVTPPPVEDVDAFGARNNGSDLGSSRRWGVSVHYYEALPSGAGWRTEVGGHGEDGSSVTFRNFHLRRSVYETAARRGGMGGRLAWRDVEIPPESRDKYGEDFERAYFASGPHMGVLVVEK